MSIDFNPALSNVSSYTPAYRVEIPPLSEQNPFGAVAAPSAQQISALQSYYGGVLTDVDQVRNLGAQCSCGYEDQGAGQAIEALKGQNPQGTITAEQIYRLIHSATSDLDSSAAGKEFNDLQKFIQANWNRLDEKAKEVWLVYYEKVMEQRAQGKSGIPQGEYDQMLREMREISGCPENEQYKDASAGAAIQALDRENPDGVISGDQMLRLIYDATSDGDSQAAGKEYDDLAKWVQANHGRLSAEAKEIWQIYAKTVEELRAQGKTGIPNDRYEQMLNQMRELQGSNDEAAANYDDAGAGDAIESLNRSNPNGQISANEMRRLILDATKDFDSQAASAEYEDLKRFVDANTDRLSPEAREIWDIYKRTVEESRSQGGTGIDNEAYQRMIKEMKDVG